MYVMWVCSTIHMQKSEESAVQLFSSLHLPVGFWGGFQTVRFEHQAQLPNELSHRHWSHSLGSILSNIPIEMQTVLWRLWKFWEIFGFGWCFQETWHSGPVGGWFEFFLFQWHSSPVSPWLSPGHLSVQEWMEQCIHWEAMCPDYWSPVGQVSKSCFVLGKKNSKTKCVSLFPMSVNTSGHIDGDHGAWSNAGETITEAARNIHARSFGGSTASWGCLGDLIFVAFFF